VKWNRARRTQFVFAERSRTMRFVQQLQRSLGVLIVVNGEAVDDDAPTSIHRVR
jgi:hypothetical protein